MAHPTPRRADWLGIPVALDTLDYEPLDFTERAAASRSALRDLDWPIPLTRCGEPPITAAEQRVLLPRPTARTSTYKLTPIGEMLLDAG